MALSPWQTHWHLPNANISFLVACYVTLHPAISVRRSVGPFVTFYFFFSSMASLLLPKWTKNLKWGSCPLARDWWSRVSSLDHLSNLLFVFVCFDSRPLISGKTQIQDENVVARKRSSTKGNLFHLKWNEMKLVEIPKKSESNDLVAINLFMNLKPQRHL